MLRKIKYIMLRTLFAQVVKLIQHEEEEVYVHITFLKTVNDQQWSFKHYQSLLFIIYTVLALC